MARPKVDLSDPVEKFMGGHIIGTTQTGQHKVSYRNKSSKLTKGQKTGAKRSRKD